MPKTKTASQEELEDVFYQKEKHLERFDEMLEDQA